MKFSLVSVSVATGLAKLTNNPFAIHRVTALLPFDSINNQKYQLSGFGFTPREIEVSQSFFNDLLLYFEKNFKGLPVEVDLDTSVNGRMQTVIIGFAKKSVGADPFAPK